jgi:hypothetical protein
MSNHYIYGGPPSNYPSGVTGKEDLFNEGPDPDEKEITKQVTFLRIEWEQLSDEVARLPAGWLKSFLKELVWQYQGK